MTQMTKRAEFSATVTRLANSFLADLVGPDQLQQAAGRLAMADAEHQPLTARDDSPVYPLRPFKEK